MTRGTLVLKMTRNKRRRVCAAFAIACLSALGMSAQDQPKKYDLKLTWKNAVEGHKSELSQDDSQAMMMKVLNGDGKILTQQEDNRSRSFAAVEVISKIEDGKPAVSRWTFSKATQHREDQDVPFAFQGRTVVVTKDPASKKHFAFDDGKPVSTEDATVLAGLWDSETEPGKLSGEEIFAPKSPVAVGEQWMPDIATIAQGLEIGDGIDLKRSTVKATLKSTEMRDGVEFGHIKIFMELWLTKFGPMRLDDPVLMKFEGDIDACIDGAQPDGTMNITMDAKGHSAAKVDSPPGEVQISIDFDSKLQQRQKTIK
ncbi:MAG TPA: hypothetical protein VN310_08670 [Candidatus Dormibacteraeota bacterium]|jgi:hypothetical protein|nr:hypothetical protein [Candidatus Dormibacteraeota bacterium]